MKNELENYLFPNGFGEYQNVNKKKDRNDMWLDICLVSLKGSKLITVDDMEVILDHLESGDDITNIILKSGQKITESDVSEIIKSIGK